MGIASPRSLGWCCFLLLLLLLLSSSSSGAVFSLSHVGVLLSPLAAFILIRLPPLVWCCFLPLPGRAALGGGVLHSRPSFGEVLRSPLGWCCLLLSSCSVVLPFDQKKRNVWKQIVSHLNLSNPNEGKTLQFVGEWWFVFLFVLKTKRNTRIKKTDETHPKKKF